MPNIVVSYRRDDSLHITGRIVDRLEQFYGKGCVFWDIDSIPYGVDFREQRRNLLDRCDVLVEIVGSRWSAPDASGTYPIADPTDWVRIEIETALSKNIPIIPVTIDRARMPKPNELPESLQDFAYHQPAELDSRRDFHPHMERLIRAIAERVEDREIEAKRHGDTEETRQEGEAAGLQWREDEERLRPEAEAKRRTELEARGRQAAEQRQRREAEAKHRNELEARGRQAAEQRQRREAEAKRHNEWEARRQQAAEVQKLKEDAERQRRETEARRRNKLEARRQQAVEARTLREAEAERRDEWEALRQQAAEAQKLREDAERQRREAEAERRNELEALRQQVAEALERRHAEAKRRNELEARRRQAAEEQKASEPLEHQPAEPKERSRKHSLLRRTLMIASALPFVILGIEAWSASTQSSPADVGAPPSQRNSAPQVTTAAPAQNRAAAAIDQRRNARPLLQFSTSPVLIADLAKCKIASGGVAIAACSRAIVSGMLTGTDLASVFDSRGILYYARRDNDSAITDFSAAIKLDPKIADAFYGRGLAKQQKGDRAGGAADIAAATAIDPNAAKQLSKQLRAAPTITSAPAP